MIAFLYFVYFNRWRTSRCNRKFVMAQIELYHFWDSFCSFKVRICLEEKALVVDRPLHRPDGVRESDSRPISR